MDLILSISIILTTCTSILFASPVIDFAPMKSCEHWILDRSDNPEYDSKDRSLNYNLAAAYSIENKDDPDRYNNSNFWKNAYTRFKCIEELSSPYTWSRLNPDEFCKRVGGTFVLKSEALTHEKKLPCYLWILISGYHPFIVDQNIQTAKNRKWNSLDKYLSGYAKDYAAYLLQKNDDDEASSSSSASENESNIHSRLLDKKHADNKLNPQEFCLQKLNLDHIMEVQNRVL